DDWEPLVVSRAVQHLVTTWIERHCLVALDPAWLTWNDGAVPSLAREIRGAAAFERLPILGDALEEAGCTHAELLNHCRHAGGHGRGCLVVDALLGERSTPPRD